MTLLPRGAGFLVDRPAVRQRDAVSLAAFDEQVSTYLPPRSTNVQLKHVLATLDGLVYGSRTRCGHSINLLANGIKRRGLTIVISDFFDEPETILQGLRHLRFKRQDVLLLWVLDPQETDFSERKTYQLQDMETGRTLHLDGRTAARYLREGIGRHQEQIENGCRELQVDFFRISTDEPFVHALMRVLQARKRMY